MKRAITLLAVVGLAAAAQAQNNVITAYAEPSSGQLTPNVPITIRIDGTFQNAGGAFGLANLRATVNVSANGNEGSLARSAVGSDNYPEDDGDAANVGMWNVFRDLFNPNSNNDSPFNGAVDNNPNDGDGLQITGIDGSQNPQANGIQGNPFNGSDGRAKVYSFDYTYTGPADGRVITITISGSGRGFTNAQGSTAARVNYQDVVVQLTVVPAPGALALLGLGGLVAARRRR